MKKITILGLAIAAMVSGCGGGGGDGTAAPAPAAPPSNMQGFWAAPDMNSIALITPAGEAWVVDAYNHGVSKLKVTEDGSAFTASGFYYSDKAPVAVSGQGSFVAKSSLKGTITDANKTQRTISAVYDPNYDKPATLADVTGSYTDGNNGVYQVAANGTITGTLGHVPGCTITGTVQPDSSGKNFYRLSLKEGTDASCPLPGAIFTGVLGAPVIYEGQRFVVGGIISDKQYGEPVALIGR